MYVCLQCTIGLSPSPGSESWTTPAIFSASPPEISRGPESYGRRRLGAASGRETHRVVIERGLFFTSPFFCSPLTAQSTWISCGMAIVFVTTPSPSLVPSPPSLCHGTSSCNLPKPFVRNIWEASCTTRCCIDRPCRACSTWLVLPADGLVVQWYERVSSVH